MNHHNIIDLYLPAQFSSNSNFLYLFEVSEEILKEIEKNDELYVF
jgi:hypothetical protein